MTYDQVENDSRSLNEDRDCAVRAVTIVTGLPYKQVHAAFAKRGRRHRRATPRITTLCVLADLGFTATLVTDNFRSKTVRTLNRELPCKGAFLIGVNGHILGARGGEVIDWTAGRLNRVKAIFKVERIHLTNGV